MEIIPAILESNISALATKLQSLQNFPPTLPPPLIFPKVLQIDVIDGQLLPTLTVTPHDLIPLDFTPLTLDFHFMTEEPLDYLYELASQKPPLPTRAVFGQLERMSDQLAFLQAAQQYHYQAGLALDLFTPLDSLADNVWPHLDTILLLAVPMGAQGQTFQDSVFAKITALQKILTTHSSSAKIYLDGGITTTQIPALQKLGLAGVAMGSFFWSGKFKSSLQN